MEFQFPDVRGYGTGTCTGPAISLVGFPLLNWADPHVVTNDYAATVEQIAVDVSVIHDYEAIAAKHGTTAEHVRQAIEYAAIAGLPKT